MAGWPAAEAALRRKRLVQLAPRLALGLLLAYFLLSSVLDRSGSPQQPQGELAVLSPLPPPLPPPPLSAGRPPPCMLCRADAGATQLPIAAAHQPQQATIDAQQQQQQCGDGAAAPDTAGSVWETHCVKVQRVCLDSSVLILHEPQYQQVGKATAAAAALPSLSAARSTRPPTPLELHADAAGGHEACGGAAVAQHPSPCGAFQRVPVPLPLAGGRHPAVWRDRGPAAGSPESKDRGGGGRGWWRRGRPRLAPQPDVCCPGACSTPGA